MIAKRLSGLAADRKPFHKSLYYAYPIERYKAGWRIFVESAKETCCGDLPVKSRMEAVFDDKNRNRGEAKRKAGRE